MKKLFTLLLVLTGMVNTASAWNYLVGTFNGWAISAEYCLDNGPVAVHLNADTYEFKVNGGDWYGADDATITGTTENISMSTSGGNIQLTVTTPGYYVFTTDWSSGLKLTVRFPDTTVYFYNALGWSNVYMHDGWWNGDNGASNKNALRGIAMTAGANNIYSAYIPRESFYRVTFTSDKQVNEGTSDHGEGYNNFYSTNVVWNADEFDSKKPLYAPTTTVSEELNNCSYYYGGAWHAYPTYTRGVTEGNFGTICLPFAATVTNATIYKITSYVGSSVESLTGINIDPVEGNAVEAGKAYIFKATGSTLTATMTGGYAAATDAYGMMGNIGGTENVPTGNYVVGTDNKIHLVVAGEGDDHVTVGQYKAYITLTGLNAGARGADFIAFDNESTGIETVKQEVKANGEYYNIAGQRVAQPTKGLYIVNGKKVIIK